MLVYPQLLTGALAQFPIEKRQHTRTVVTRAADGHDWKLPDPAGGATEWHLTYTDLSDDEAHSLSQFFEAAEGRLRSFTFLDPLGNLIAHSEEMESPIWVKGPMLTLTANVPDPSGGHSAWRLSNMGAAPQRVYQTLDVPKGYVYSCSAYVRCAETSSVTMLLGSHQATREGRAAWHRIQFTSTGDRGSEPLKVGLEIPAGTTLESYGFQAEAQTSASTYKPTAAGGVYENARLLEDSFELTTTGPNRNSCTVKIIHVKHL
jgi:hypothetical protein